MAQGLAAVLKERSIAILLRRVNHWPPIFITQEERYTTLPHVVMSSIILALPNGCEYRMKEVGPNCNTL